MPNQRSVWTGWHPAHATRPTYSAAVGGSAGAAATSGFGGTCAVSAAPSSPESAVRANQTTPATAAAPTSNQSNPGRRALTDHPLIHSFGTRRHTADSGTRATAAVDDLTDRLIVLPARPRRKLRLGGSGAFPLLFLPDVRGFGRHGIERRLQLATRCGGAGHALAACDGMLFQNVPLDIVHLAVAVEFPAFVSDEPTFRKRLVARPWIVIAIHPLTRPASFTLQLRKEAAAVEPDAAGRLRAGKLQHRR